MHIASSFFLIFSLLQVIIWLCQTILVIYSIFKCFWLSHLSPVHKYNNIYKIKGHGKDTINNLNPALSWKRYKDNTTELNLFQK